MNFDALKKILSERTPGHWTYSTCYGVASIECPEHDDIAMCVGYLRVKDRKTSEDTFNNADSIVTLNNIADELVAVAEAAAKLVTATIDPTIETSYADCMLLCEAIEALKRKSRDYDRRQKQNRMA